MKLNMRADLWGSSRITEPTDRRVSLASFLLAFKAGRVKFRIVGDGVVTWELEGARWCGKLNTQAEMYPVFSTER